MPSICITMSATSQDEFDYFKKAFPELEPIVLENDDVFKLTYNLNIALELSHFVDKVKRMSHIIHMRRNNCIIEDFGATEAIDQFENLVIQLRQILRPSFMGKLRLLLRKAL